METRNQKHRPNRDNAYRQDGVIPPGVELLLS